MSHVHTYSFTIWAIPFHQKNLRTCASVLTCPNCPMQGISYDCRHTSCCRSVPRLSLGCHETKGYHDTWISISIVCSWSPHPINTLQLSSEVDSRAFPQEWVCMALNIWWSATSAEIQKTTLPLEHHSDKFRNAAKWVIHISPPQSIFPLEIVWLQDFRPSIPSSIQSRLWLGKGVGTVVCHQGKGNFPSFQVTTPSLYGTHWCQHPLLC